MMLIRSARATLQGLAELLCQVNKGTLDYSPKLHLAYAYTSATCTRVHQVMNIIKSPGRSKVTRGFTTQHLSTIHLCTMSQVHYTCMHYIRTVPSLKCSADRHTQLTQYVHKYYTIQRRPFMLISTDRQDRVLDPGTISLSTMYSLQFELILDKTSKEHTYSICDSQYSGKHVNPAKVTQLIRSIDWAAASYTMYIHEGAQS